MKSSLLTQYLPTASITINGNRIIITVH